MIVSEKPGTTRDAIDTIVERGDQTFVFVDTAGLRRKRRQRQGIEYYSELRAIQAAERADVALVLIDSSEGMVDQDFRVADVARTAGCSTLVILSKWDITTIDVEDIRPVLEERLRQRPTLVAVSAKSGRGVDRTLDKIAELFARHTARIPTPAAERLPPGAARPAAGPDEARQGPQAEPPVRDADRGAPAEVQDLRERSGPDDARLRLLGRESAERAIRSFRRAGHDRLRTTRMNIAVIGGGSWGSAFGALLADRGHDVALACRDPEQAHAIAVTGRNPRYLPELDLSGVRAVPLDDPALADAETFAIAVPSAAFRERRRRASGERRADPQPREGPRSHFGRPPLDVVEGRAVAVLSGPNHAEEISLGLPAAAVIASEDESVGDRLQEEVHSDTFRVYGTTDVVGVELCAAAKNVIAIGAGAVDGLGLGDNAKAGLLTRGLAEMVRLGEVSGARSETFSGLAGMGDLMVTCWSRHSRNRRAGELIGRGATPEEAKAEIAMAVEGITTAPVLRDLAHRLDIELPITEAVCRALEGEHPRDIVARLMGRAPTGE